jgi:hypothetical protein
VIRTNDFYKRRFFVLTAPAAVGFACSGQEMKVGISGGDRRREFAFRRQTFRTHRRLSEGHMRAERLSDRIGVYQMRRGRVISIKNNNL